jgi:phospholipid/cholesterol/gamma-HCH transport system permease protein
LVLALIAGLSGMILVMQTGPELAKWGTTDALGPVVAATFTREMGPVWAAIIVLARVGSAMAAELGTMVVNEEVEALRVMDIDPVRYLVLPRVIGLLITLPLLTVVANVVGLAGGALVAQSQFQVPIADFMEGAAWMLTGYDFLGSLIKGAVFGLVIGVICCDQGLACKAGAEGVGRATTTAVRLCVVFVLLTDLVVTAVLASVGRLL